MNRVLVIFPVLSPINLTIPFFPAMAFVNVQLSTTRLARPAMLNIGLDGLGVSETKIMFLKLTVPIVSFVYVKTFDVPVLFMIAPSSAMKYKFLDN